MNGITLVVTALAIGGLTAFVRSRNQKLAAEVDLDAARTLQLSGVFAAVGAVGIVVFGGIAVLAFLTGTDADPGVFRHETPEDASRYALFFVAFSGLGWMLLLIYALCRIDVDARGARGRDALLRTFELGWAEVTRVSANESMRWLRLELASGRAVRVSFDLHGIAVLVHHLRRQVPVDRWAPAERVLTSLGPRRS